MLVADDLTPERMSRPGTDTVKLIIGATAPDVIAPNSRSSSGSRWAGAELLDSLLSVPSHVLKRRPVAHLRRLDDRQATVRLQHNCLDHVK
jgi:hypothetical protein